MPENKPETNTPVEENFASRTKDVIHLYRSILDISNERIEQIKKHIHKTKYEAVWKKFLDLRFIGVFMITIDFVLKALQIIKSSKILEPTEFVAVFIIGTLLLVMGTYFNIKEIQDDRKLIDKENETITNTITACTGLLQNKP